MRASPSFPRLMDIIGTNLLWLVYLGMGALRNIPKELLRLPLFQGNSLSSPAYHGLPISFCWWENSICSSVGADEL